MKKRILALLLVCAMLISTVPVFALEIGGSEGVTVTGQEDPGQEGQGGSDQDNPGQEDQGGFDQDNPGQEDQGGFDQDNPGQEDQGGSDQDNPGQEDQGGSAQEGQEGSAQEGQGGSAQEGQGGSAQEGQGGSGSEGQGGSGQDNPDAPPVDIPETPVPGAAGPGQEVPALYIQLLAAASIVEVEALLTDLTDEELGNVISSLTEEQLAALDAHLNALFDAEEVKTEPEPEEQDSFVEHVPEIINLAVNVMNPAPLLPPVSAPILKQRGLLKAQAAPAAVNDGLELIKSVSAPDTNGEYTLTLEAYATGNKIVTPTQKAVPVDIVLVLDQSGSMYENDMPVTNYTEITENDRKASNLYNIADDGELYAVLGGDNSYSRVTVNRTERFNYPSLSSNTNTQNYNNSRNNLYHKVSDDVYHKVGVSWEFSGISIKYTYTCAEGDWTKTSTDRNQKPDFAGELYSRGSSNGYRYTFAYTDANGNNVVQTVDGANTVVTSPIFKQSSETTKRRLTALQDAVTTFADTVKEKAQTDNVKHRVAIVGFSGSGYNNTELLTGVTITKGSQQSNGTNKFFPLGYEYNGVQYGSITIPQYAGALQDMQTTAGQTSVANAISALTAYGGTYTLDGLTMAEDIFKNSPIPLQAETQRSRVVVLFTDGDTNSNRNDTIAKANALKNTYNATVFTVGIFENADGTPPIPQNASSANKLMHLISSNYPNATGNDDATWGTVNPNLKNEESYFLSAGDANALNTVFQKIADQIEGGNTSVTLDANAVLKDTISSYFELAEGTPVHHAYELAYTGNNTWASTPGASYTSVYDPETKTVSVTGFNYKDNYVWDNPQAAGGFGGKKLVLEIKIKPRDGFWGGNNVPTNGPGSGVYENVGSPSPVEAFETPHANVPLKNPVVTVVNHNIYAGNPAPTPEALIGVSDIPSGWQTQYVTVVRTPNPISNVIDGTYSVTVTVTPEPALPDSAGTPAQEWIGSATATVTVFKPVVTFRDSKIAQGNVANYAGDNLVSTVWKNGETVANPATMTGTAPTLTFTYSPEAGAFTTDTNVSVTTVTAQENEVAYLPLATFAWVQNPGACADTAVPAGAHFRVHVLIPNFNLTITKTVTGGTPTQSFIFDITGANNFSMSVVLSPGDFDANGTAAVTIVGLPSGTYTVTERGNWSWQYVLNGSNNQTVTEVGGTAKTVTFTNERNTVNWLGDTAIIRNIFAVKSGRGV